MKLDFVGAVATFLWPLFELNRSRGTVDIRNNRSLVISFRGEVEFKGAGWSGGAMMKMKGIASFSFLISKLQYKIEVSKVN